LTFEISSLVDHTAVQITTLGDIRTKSLKTDSLPTGSTLPCPCGHTIMSASEESPSPNVRKMSQHHVCGRLLWTAPYHHNHKRG